MKTIRLALRSLEQRVTPSTVIVKNLNDLGPDSLRAALATADALPGKDTIVFRLPAPPANEVNTITLASGLTSKGNVTISGPGAGRLIVSGNNISRVFNLDDADSGTDSPTTISGLSIVNGKAAGGTNGGGIHSVDSLTLKNVVMTGNSADFGGGVFVDGNNAFTAVNITGSRFDRNSGTFAYGGIDIFDVKSITISRSTFSGNTGASGEGGAMYLEIGSQGTSIAVSGCTVMGNSAGRGGGIFAKNLSTLPAAKTTISGCVLSGNTSTSAGIFGGGGLYLTGGNIAISGSTIANNTAERFGGGIDVRTFSSLTISKSTISGNRTTTSAGLQGGGGIAIRGTGLGTLNPATITGSTIAHNSSAADGGGVFATNGVKLTISGTKIYANRTVVGGGGLRAFGTGNAKVDLSVNGSTFADNFAGDTGGGLLAVGDGSIAITAARIVRNHSSSGGGIRAQSSVPVNGLIIKNSVISDNTSTSSGGGLYIISTPSFRISGGSFTNNSSQLGGGIHVAASSGAVQSRISGNSATNSGGGISQAGGGTVELQIAKVFGNIALVSPNIVGTFTFV